MNRFALPLLALPSTATAAQTLYLRTFHSPSPGEPIALRLSGVTPGETAVFVGGASVAAGASCPPGLAVCLDVVGARVIGRGVADPAGAVAVQVVLPAGLAVGGVVALQAVQPSNGDTSMAITRTLVQDIDLAGVYDDPSGIWGQIEVDDQSIRDTIMETEIADYDPAAEVAFSTWMRPNGWYYWERVDWTTWGGAWWMCRSMPNPSERNVRMMGGADRTNPATGGCMGAPWIELVPAEPEIAGVWTDPLGRTLTVDTSGWTWGTARSTASRFSNRDGLMISQNDAAGPHPGRWSRLQWSTAGGSPSVCLVTHDAPTEWAARSAAPADPTLPNTGCAGRAWVQLR